MSASAGVYPTGPAGPLLPNPYGHGHHLFGAIDPTMAAVHQQQQQQQINCLFGTISPPLNSIHPKLFSKFSAAVYGQMLQQALLAQQQQQAMVAASLAQQKGASGDGQSVNQRQTQNIED
jgi:hypothetical protein